jgi:hypothetical protein
LELYAISIVMDNASVRIYFFEDFIEVIIRLI